VPPDTNIQPLFHNGQARGWFLRRPLSLDRWLPSTLFSGMYFPEEPYRYQVVNAGNLILGYNGLWGDLLSMSSKGIAAFGEIMRVYKQVRDDMTSAAVIRTGMVSGSPEIYEKISPDTRHGAVVMFATEPGEYRYVTRRRVSLIHWATEGATVELDDNTRAIITARFLQPGAHIVFFGAK
jgi:alpha-galactosidase